MKVIKKNKGYDRKFYEVMKLGLQFYQFEYTNTNRNLYQNIF